MDLIDEANKINYRETKYLIEQARLKAKEEQLTPKGRCYNCDIELKKKSKNKLFCDADCRDDYTYYHERKKMNSK